MSFKSRFIEMFGTIDLSIQDPEWRELGSLGKILTGSTPKTNVSDYWDGNIKWITPAELGPGLHTVYDTERKITEEGRRSCSLNVLKPGVVLLTSRAPIGKVAIVGCEMYCNQGFKNIECGPELNNIYLYTLLRFNADYLNSLGRGATFKEISAKIVASIRVPTPSEDRQNAFADFVKQVDQSKVVCRRIFQSFDNLVKSRFIEMFGNPNINPRYPKDRIGSFSKCCAGATPSTAVKDYWDGGTIPWMSSGEVNQERVTSTERCITQVGFDSCSTCMIPANSVVVALAGQGRTRGTAAITGIELCTNQSLCAIITNESIDSTFLLHHLKFLYHRMREMSNGAGGRGGLNLSIIRDVEVMVPPIDVQKRFADFVKQVDKSKFSSQSAGT